MNRICISPLHFQRQAPLQPLQRHNTDDAADIPEPVAALSGCSRTSTPPQMHFQRQPLVFPFVVSATVDVLWANNVQCVQ